MASFETYPTELVSGQETLREFIEAFPANLTEPTDDEHQRNLQYAREKIRPYDSHSETRPEPLAPDAYDDDYFERLARTGLTDVLRNREEVSARSWRYPTVNAGNEWVILPESGKPVRRYETYAVFVTSSTPNNTSEKRDA